MPSRRFTDPPINEVVCGVVFGPVEALDPLLVGRFWNLHADVYPKKQLLPAIVRVPTEGVVFDFGLVPPLRSWLISADDSRVMQIQADRFYLNWRARDSAYPSFNERDGRTGLRSEIKTALASFGTFIESTTGHPLEPMSVEMSMIDLFRQGRHWSDVADLKQLLPGIKSFLGDGPGLPPALQLQFDRSLLKGILGMSVQRATMRVSGEDVVKLEARRVVQVTGLEAVDEAFVGAHDDLKRAFDSMVPEEQFHRFETGWRP